MLMGKRLDNTALWNEAAKGGALLGAVSVGCLCLKEWATVSGSAFLMQAAAIILWAVEFFGCILLMKKLMLDLRDRYEGVKMEHTYKLGRRIALLSGLLLASAQALFILRMSPESIDTMLTEAAGSLGLTAKDMESAGAVVDRLPLYTFLFQWTYCFLYGTLMAGFLSRYIFLQRILGGSIIGREFPQPEEQPGTQPEEQSGEPQDPELQDPQPEEQSGTLSDELPDDQSGEPQEEDHGDAHRPEEH